MLKPIFSGTAAYLALAIVLQSGVFIYTQTLNLKMAAYLGWVPYLPWALLAGALGLALRFRFSQLAYLAMLLALLLLMFGRLSPLAPGNLLPATPAVALLAILLPLNCLALSFLPNRGFFSLIGAGILVLIALQAALVVAAIHRPALLPADLLFYAPPLTLPGTLQVPFPAAVVNLLSALFLVILALRRRSLITAAFFAGLLGAWTLFNGAVGNYLSEYAVSAAALLLLVSLIQESYRLAFHDTLTGLPSRRALELALNTLGRGRYTLAMVDIDHFKKVNDTYGHDVGDQMLRFIAARLTRVRYGGRVFRYGGEEFTIIFPRKTRDEVLHCLESLRRDIERAPLALRGKDRPKKKPRKTRKTGRHNTLSATVSIGVAENSRQDRPADIIKVADANLYKAKKKGRNRVFPA